METEYNLDVHKKSTAVKNCDLIVCAESTICNFRLTLVGPQTRVVKIKNICGQKGIGEILWKTIF